MPAAAVIPAPIAYIKVVAVKKLVVEILDQEVGTRLLPLGLILAKMSSCINLCVDGVVSFTVNKLGCLKQAYV